MREKKPQVIVDDLGESPAVAEISAQEAAAYESMIGEWKKQYGKIFSTSFEGVEVVWRKLRRKEYVSIMGEVKENESEKERIWRRQEAISKVVALWPENIEEIIEENAGIATLLSEEVVDHSGFDITAQTKEI